MEKLISKDCFSQIIAKRISEEKERFLETFTNKTRFSMIAEHGRARFKKRGVAAILFSIKCINWHHPVEKMGVKIQRNLNTTA